MERESLYAAICANPRDDLPKLVFADWLDEHGDAADRAHAELIRIQCEWEGNARGNERALEPYRLTDIEAWWPDAATLAKSDPVAASAARMLERAAHLESTLPAKPRVRPPQFDGVSYRYNGRIPGLKTELSIRREQTWEAQMATIAEGFPLRELVMDAPYSPRYEPWDHRRFDARVLSNLESLTSGKRALTALTSAIVASPATAHLKRLSAIHSHLLGELFEILERAEHLTQLEEIEIDQIGNSGSDRGFARFDESVVRNLRRLRVGHNNWDRPYRSLPLLLQFSAVECKLEELEMRDASDADVVAEYLCRGELACPGLAKLGLPLGGIGTRGTCDLLTSDRFPALRHLDVSENSLGEFVGKQLERTVEFPKLHSLNLEHTQLSDAGISALVNWKGYQGLRKLILSRIAFNHASIRALVSGDVPNLRTLSLRNCRLHGSHVRELVRSRFVRSLWSLDLRGNTVDDTFIRALIETPFLDALQCLLVDVPEDDDRLRIRFGDQPRVP